MPMASFDIIQNIEEITAIDCHDLENLEECRLYTNDSEPSFKILSFNIRSYQRNFDDFSIAFNRLEIDIDAIVLTECWLSEGSILDNLPGYNVTRTTTQNNKNGGIVIYTKANYDVIAIEPKILDTDSLLLILNNKVAILGLYRSPSFTNLSNFIASLDIFLKTASKHPTLIITGDINIDICSTTNNKHHDYMCLLASYGLLPVITKPTRQKSCLDHIFVKCNTKPRGIVCKSSITDHDVVIANIPLKNTYTSRNKKRRMLKLNEDDLATELAKIDWTDTLNQHHVASVADSFIGTLAKLIESHTYETKIPRSKRNIQPWITPGLMRCMKHRDRLHLSVRSDPTNKTKKIIYKRYKNFCNKLLRNLKIEYDSRQIQENKQNSQKLWKVLKSIYDPSVRKCNTSNLLSSSLDPVESLNKCNFYFTSVGKNLADTILTKLSETQSSITSKYSSPTTSPFSFFLHPTDETEVINYVNQLKNDSSPGPDKISVKLIKKILPLIITPLTHLINLSLETGEFPEQWKVAAVSPIHKSGPKDKPENYRPIALLSILSKILEKVVNTRLVNFLEKHSIISQRQFGFRKGKSTEDAALLLTNTISSIIEKGDRCMAVFLDLAKAFDTISIDLLLKKLDSVGIKGKPLEWFHSYLSNRRQYVKSDDHLSDELPISFGVPQGSLLGPTLFIIYMNDILNLKLKNAELISYADDTVITFHGRNWEQVYSTAEEGLATIAQTLNHNLLTLNTKKTKHIPFYKTLSSSPPPNLTLKFHTCLNNPNPSHADCTCDCIDRTQSIRYLGLLIDENLSFKAHIKHLSGRVRKLIHIIKKLRDRTPIDVMRTVYFSVCQSIIQYGISIWGGAGKTTIIELERAQRAVIKVLLKKSFFFPTDSLYSEFLVLRVRQLYILNAFLRTHKTIKLRPDYRSLTSKRVYHIPLQRTTSLLARRCPAYLHTFVYNKVTSSLPCDTKTLTLSMCKKTVKKWLLGLNYDDSENLLMTFSSHSESYPRH